MDVHDHGGLIRSRVSGMLVSGTMQKGVAQCLGLSVPSVKRWWSSHISEIHDDQTSFREASYFETCG